MNRLQSSISSYVVSMEAAGGVPTRQEIVIMGRVVGLAFAKAYETDPTLHAVFDMLAQITAAAVMGDLPLTKAEVEERKQMVTKMMGFLTGPMTGCDLCGVGPLDDCSDECPSRQVVSGPAMPDGPYDEQGMRDQGRGDEV